MKLHKSIGFLGEDLTCNYLKKEGYLILERNFTCKIGEIDIIGTNENCICFIEVKSRYNYSNIYPRESVNLYKQKKIYRIAEFYILINKIKNINFRFDVVEVYFNKNNDFYKINLIKNAF